MAVITSTGTGAFTSTSSWVGGVVPGPGDTAVAGAGSVITISGTVTCTAIDNPNTTGYFVLSDGATLNANVQGGARTDTANGVLRYSGTTGATINGNVTVTQTSFTGATVIDHRGTGLLTINGNVSSVVKTATQNNRYAIFCGTTTGQKIRVNGNVTGGSGTNAGTGQYGIFSGQANTEVTIVGNLSVIGSSSTCLAISMTGANSTATITGDIFGGEATNSFGLVNTGTGSTTTVTGTVWAGVGAGGISVTNQATVNGNVYGGNATSCPAVNSSSATITINGDCVAGTGSPGVSNLLSSAVTRINGNIYASSGSAGATNAQVVLNGNAYDHETGQQAITAPVVRIVNPATHVHVRLTSAVVTPAFTLLPGEKVATADTNTEALVSVADVRSGVNFNGGLLTGTMQIPAVGDVAVGVPVDDTVGTAELPLASAAATLGTQIAAAASAGGGV